MATFRLAETDVTSCLVLQVRLLCVTDQFGPWAEETALRMRQVGLRVEVGPWCTACSGMSVCLPVPIDLQPSCTRTCIVEVVGHTPLSPGWPCLQPPARQPGIMPVMLCRECTHQSSLISPRVEPGPVLCMGAAMALQSASPKTVEA